MGVTVSKMPCSQKACNWYARCTKAVLDLTSICSLSKNHESKGTHRLQTGCTWGSAALFRANNGLLKSPASESTAIPFLLVRSKSASPLVEAEENPKYIFCLAQEGCTHVAIINLSMMLPLNEVGGLRQQFHVVNTRIKHCSALQNKAHTFDLSLCTAKWNHPFRKEENGTWPIQKDTIS